MPSFSASFYYIWKLAVNIILYLHFLSFKEVYNGVVRFKLFKDL